MLYRPFLHYISPRLPAGQVVDDRYYACAAAGISVSRNIIHIALEIQNQALVIGPFWSLLYTEFFAILTLVFYTLENPDKQGSAEVYADANAGREMIAKMAPRSFAADRINSSLSTLWENLPESVKNGKTHALPTRKRSAPGPKPGPVPLSTHQTTISTSKAPCLGSRSSVSHRPVSQHYPYEKYSRPDEDALLRPDAFPMPNGVPLYVSGSRLCQLNTCFVEDNLSSPSRRQALSVPLFRVVLYKAR